MDEVRVSAVVRSAGWIATQHENHANPGGFLTLGRPEPRAASGRLASTVPDPLQ